MRNRTKRKILAGSRLPIALAIAATASYLPIVKARDTSADPSARVHIPDFKTGQCGKQQFGDRNAGFVTFPAKGEPSEEAIALVIVSDDTPASAGVSAAARQGLFYINRAQLVASHRFAGPPEQYGLKISHQISDDREHDVRLLGDDTNAVTEVTDLWNLSESDYQVLICAAIDLSTDTMAWFRDDFSAKRIRLEILKGDKVKSIAGTGSLVGHAAKFQEIFWSIANRLQQTL